MKPSSALDESILLKRDALLLIYIFSIHNEQVCQELLCALTLKTDTKGQRVQKTTIDFFQTEEITDVVVCATDRAAARGSRNQAYLTDAVLKVLTIHCVVHRQHQEAKILT